MLTMIPEKIRFNEKYTMVIANNEIVVIVPVCSAMRGFFSLNPFHICGIRA